MLKQMRGLGLLTIGVACLWLLAVSAPIEAKKKLAPKQNTNFDYYLLTLSYAPDFCNQPNGVKDPRECGNGRQTSFVVHGLWPQAETNRGPENCGPASPVSQSIVNAMLRYIPTESLIQHEWRTHGVCSGLNTAEYFAAVRKARDSVRIPAELEPGTPLSLSRSDILAKLMAANPGFPKGAFTLSCYRDRSLQEVRACFGKDLLPRPCSPSAGSCSLESLTLLPVR